MKIVIDARESGTSTGRYVDKLIEYLQALDKVNIYTLLCLPGRIDHISITSQNFHKVSTSHKKFSLGEQFVLPFTIHRLKPDLVHFPLAQQPLLYFGNIVTGMLDLTPLFYKNPSSNPGLYFIKQKLYAALHWVAIKKSQHIITISNFVKNQVMGMFKVPASKITTTYNSADKIQETPVPIKTLISKKFIMYVGRPTPHKNLERLMDAYSLLLEKHPDLYLVLAGKKNALMTVHEQRAAGFGLKNVLVTGFVSEGELRWLYENCAAYVFPSLSEGFGLPGLEAMQHGAPVISSNATCLPEIYGDAAVYFDPLNTQDITDKIDNVLSNPKVSDDLKNKGFKKANEYSWQRMAEQTLEIYQKALSKQ